jgi:hypothetical protein
MRPAHIEVEIEELVLRGFPPVDGHAIRDALRAELERLLAETEPPGFQEESTTHSLDGGRIELARSATPEAVGKRLALALYGGLTR